MSGGSYQTKKIEKPCYQHASQRATIKTKANMTIYADEAPYRHGHYWCQKNGFKAAFPFAPPIGVSHTRTRVNFNFNLCDPNEINLTKLWATTHQSSASL